MSYQSTIESILEHLNSKKFSAAKLFSKLGGLKALNTRKEILTKLQAAVGEDSLPLSKDELEDIQASLNEIISYYSIEYQKEIETAIYLLDTLLDNPIETSECMEANNEDDPSFEITKEFSSAAALSYKMQRYKMLNIHPADKTLDEILNDFAVATQFIASSGASSEQISNSLLLKIIVFQRENITNKAMERLSYNNRKATGFCDKQQRIKAMIDVINDMIKPLEITFEEFCKKESVQTEFENYLSFKGDAASVVRNLRYIRDCFDFHSAENGKFKRIHDQQRKINLRRR